MRILCTGAGGFISGHLVKRLLEDGHEVVAVDIKEREEWYQVYSDAENHYECDLASYDNAKWVCSDIDQVYHLAASMGGIAFITNYPLDCMLSVLPTINVLTAAASSGVQRLFYSSSACVYSGDKQSSSNVTALKEEDAFPSMAEYGYGEEKLFSERLCEVVAGSSNLETRVARYHNVYGVHGTWDGGKEKAPSALARKVVEATISGDLRINIWGDGEQTRSYMDVDDCVEGTIRIMNSDCAEPLNLGSDRLISVNDLVSLYEDIAGVKLERSYDLSAPQGVRGRNSDNTKLEATIGWVPQISLEDGCERLYKWVYDQCIKSQ